MFVCVCVGDCVNVCGSRSHPSLEASVRYIAMLMHSCMSALWHQFNGARTYMRVCIHVCMCVFVCVTLKERELERGHEIRKGRDMKNTTEQRHQAIFEDNTKKAPVSLFNSLCCVTVSLSFLWIDREFQRVWT